MDIEDKMIVPVVSGRKVEIILKRLSRMMVRYKAAKEAAKTHSEEQAYAGLEDGARVCHALIKAAAMLADGRDVYIMDLSYVEMENILKALEDLRHGMPGNGADSLFSSMRREVIGMAASMLITARRS